MEAVIPPDAKEIGTIAADAIAGLLRRKPDAVLGLAIGSSPLVIYDELVARHRVGTDGHIAFTEPSSRTQIKALTRQTRGREKAEAVRQLVEGAVSALWPATVLQLHPQVTILLDEAAAERLALIGYYREAYHCKPEWQGI